MAVPLMLLLCRIRSKVVALLPVSVAFLRVLLGLFSTALLGGIALTLLAVELLLVHSLVLVVFVSVALPVAVVTSRLRVRMIVASVAVVMARVVSSLGFCSLRTLRVPLPGTIRLVSSCGLVIAAVMLRCYGTFCSEESGELRRVSLSGAIHFVIFEPFVELCLPVCKRG